MPALIGAKRALLQANGLTPGRLFAAGIKGFWFDAFQIALPSNTPVSQWNDCSGAGYHATQGTTSRQPTYLAAGINGKPAVSFDGVDDSLALAEGAKALTNNVDRVTLYIVHASVTKPASRNLLAVQTGTGGTRINVITNESNLSGAIGAGGRRLDSDTFANLVATGQFVTGQPIITTADVYYAASTLSLYTGWLMVAQTTAFQTPGTTSPTNSAAVNLGAFAAASGNCETKLGEVICTIGTPYYPSLVRYLAKKWRISA